MKDAMNSKEEMMKAAKWTLGALILSALIPVAAQAKSGSEAGFERLKTNVDNAKANLADYKSNLGIVDKNLGEITKARTAADEQKRQVANAVKENKTALGKMDAQEKELNSLTQDERNKMAAEEKKIQELEALLAKIKENKGKREANIQAYQKQIADIQTERKGWQTRGDALREQETQAAQRVKTLSATESEWKNKKKGYEGEIGRWTKETEKQEKTLQQFQQLADAKNQ